ARVSRSCHSRSTTERAPASPLNSTGVPRGGNLIPGRFDPEDCLTHSLALSIHLFRGRPENPENIFCHRESHLALSRKHFVCSCLAHDCGIAKIVRARKDAYFGVHASCCPNDLPTLFRRGTGNH